MFGGYHAIGLPLPHSSFRRFIYAKEHATKKLDAHVDSSHAESILAAGRTAYLVNLPSHASEEWLRACLEPVGAIQHLVANSTGFHREGLEVHDLPSAPRTAHVVFKSKTSMDQLLGMDVLETPCPSKGCGLQAYASTYRRDRPGLAAIKEMADRYMASFDQIETEERRRREARQHEVDQDGFHTVVNTKKRSLLPAADMLGRRAKAQRSKERQHFYRFQTREMKRDQLKTLRERFEEDRRQVERMKKAKKLFPE